MNIGLLPNSLIFEYKDNILLPNSLLFEFEQNLIKKLWSWCIYICMYYP